MLQYGYHQLVSVIPIIDITQTAQQLAMRIIQGSDKHCT